MNRRSSAGTIFWGLTLIAAGAVFLARNLGYNVPIWSGVARYWPVLLIFWGLVKLVDYYRWKRAGERGPLFSGGEVALLVLVILSGSALTAAANMSPDLGRLFDIADIDLWDITGNTYEYTQTLDEAASPGATVNIINRYGSVDVIPADVDRILVDVKKTVIAATQEEADRLSGMLTFSVVNAGAEYRVWSSLNRDASPSRGQRFRTSLRVQVPRTSAVVLDNQNGDVSIAELTGNQRITNAFGRVSVRNISGSVTLTNRNQSVTVEDISGSVTVENEFSTTAVRNIGSQVEVRHRQGAVELSNIQGGATISNSFGQVTVSGVQGPLEVRSRNGGVEIDNAQQSINVRAEFEHVRIENARNAVEVQNRNGEVRVDFAEPPTQPVRIESQFGDVTLNLPAASSFNLNATNRFGTLVTDFSELTSRSQNERSSLVGQAGSGGPEIFIQNRNGAVRIGKR